MNITIINGINDTKTNPYQLQLEMACVKLSENYKIDLFTIENMDINYCCGCFNCWLKTPGQCVFKDDMQEILKSIVYTDLFLVVSPLIAGFITSQAKKAMDRFLPQVLPYFRAYGGESHHIPRYEKRSSTGVLVLNDAEGQEEAVDIVFDTFDRFAKNYHAIKTVKAQAGLENLQEVLINEISGC